MGWASNCYALVRLRVVFTVSDLYFGRKRLAEVPWRADRSHWHQRRI